MDKPVREWQSIDSAPKDGTLVLVANAERIIRIALWQETWREWHAIPGKYSFAAPTHWMALPSPPSSD